MSASNFAEYFPSSASVPFSAGLFILFPFSEITPLLVFCRLPFISVDGGALARRDWVL